jgi:hypothetical protein
MPFEALSEAAKAAERRGGPPAGGNAWMPQKACVRVLFLALFDFQTPFSLCFGVFLFGYKYLTLSMDFAILSSDLK